MTTPSLMAKYNQNVINQKFKKAYSTVYNAFMLMQADLGTTPQCYYVYNDINPGQSYETVSECTIFWKELTKHLKVVKYCPEKAYEKGCIPKYNGSDTIPRYEGTSTVKGCGGYGQNYILNTSPAYILADGTIVFMYGNNWYSVFAIDINGKKGPNKWGEDIYSFAWSEARPGVIKLHEGLCSLVEDEEKGKDASEMFQNIIYK